MSENDKERLFVWCFVWVIFLIGALVGGCAQNRWMKLRAVDAGLAEFYADKHGEKIKFRWKVPTPPKERP